ncbi:MULTISPECIES: flagellar filament capping protein FliD [Clostridium]|nr:MULTISPECIES: flagellar filament capping protein FliD [Clostridium]MBS4840283.1 flagellar filament capping protein FliD [Clostridium sp.]MDU1401671.1 flagellar filament capping protein FliD [Clostridium sp.]MDU1601447.1 flagellar filament capping protein FliD [Clostridium sp.]MDU2894624.1 flagellar filament capping protein FliD [Clostridium sp.]MDU3006465.1 flagellar filament capping protein FliD [Clostridium sp.]
MRITGLATGLDMDEIIKNSMKPYRIKIQQQQQNKEVVEIKQKLYRDIISDASKFYDKYFDLTKSDSLLNSSSYKSVEFSSSSNSVTVKGNSEAKAGNYTITGDTATAAKAVVSEGIADGDKITVNGKDFVLKGATEKERADDLNKKLKEAGMNVSVRYSDMAGTTAGNKKGFIFESTVLGSGNSFTIGGSASDITPVNSTNGSNATAATVTGISMDKLLSGKVTINGNEIEVTLPKKENGEEVTEEEKLAAINSALKNNNLEASIDKTNGFVIKSTVSGELANDKIPKITIDGAEVGTFTNGKDATPGSTTVKPSDLTGKIISINGINVDLTKVSSETDVLKSINKVFEEQKIAITATSDGVGNVVLTSKNSGENTGIGVKEINTTGNGYVQVEQGKNANITIKDDKGGVYTHTENSNSVTLDGVTFTFNGSIDGEVKITGKNNVTETKDKIVNFINDYNTLIEKLNTLTSTKHDRSYVPLTDEQKKEMSESEIKLWNEKVENGQLYKDSNLTRITSSLKSTMRTFMEDSGLNLQEIGIVPVQDYSGTKNGTFTINEEKLTKALEDNMDGVMNLFINSAPKELTEEEKKDSKKVEAYNKAKSQTGILYQLKNTLYTEFKSSSAILSKKVGVEGTSTFSNNELTKNISNYEQKIKDMEKDFSKREQALYSKYATLETMMNKLNSQQSTLLSQLGMS